MTLTELLPEARQLPAKDKLKLIRALAEDLEGDSMSSWFPQEGQYQVLTPYGCEGAATALMEALERGEEQRL
jgi:hypothetical protein